MKIIKNTSGYDSRKLQSLFTAIHNEIAKDEGRLKHWNYLWVEIRAKSYGYSGRAYLGKVYGDGWDMFLSVSPRLTLKELSQLFAHELYHSYGFKHHQFKNDPLNEKQMARLENKFKIEDLHRVEKPKVKVDHVKLRYENAQKKLAEWESKQKRTNNLVKKWKKKVAYYEKKYTN